MTYGSDFDDAGGVSGVHSREEILRALEDKIEDIKKNPERFMLHGPKLSLLNEIKDYVLGERDEL